MHAYMHIDIAWIARFIIIFSCEVPKAAPGADAAASEVWLLWSLLCQHDMFSIFFLVCRSCPKKIHRRRRLKKKICRKMRPFLKRRLRLANSGKYICLKLQPHPPYMHTCMHACMIQEACGASGATKEEDQKDLPEDEMKEETVYWFWYMHAWKKSGQSGGGGSGSWRYFDGWGLRNLFLANSVFLFSCMHVCLGGKSCGATNGWCPGWCCWWRGQVNIYNCFLNHVSLHACMTCICLQEDEDEYPPRLPRAKKARIVRTVPLLWAIWFRSYKSFTSY